MDRSTRSGTTVGGPVSEHELSTSSARCQTESGGTILLQLLEFKTHLLEAVEELHIRRDAETRFEDQISKLVLEKQELEWEKESLQHQAETLSNRHAESLTSVKKQFQVKIRNIEEEKGKYQVSAELKDKEINNLKEELKSLQLLKYNLAKKSGELEQKLALQSRSKDSHLNQLGEVEKRFSALSRKCAMVKQAHEKLEQNVDEAMKMNKKLTSANEKQEATIVSLKEELEEVSRKLIQAKMSSVRHEKTHSPTGREQHIQQLLHKLNVETEMNEKLGEENEAVRTEKQEVMRSLQHTQQLLLSQTQTVSRVEQEMQRQREQYQGLKQEHEVMREKSKAMEDKVAQLMESYAAARTGWDKERVMFLDRIKSEQQDLQAVREAHDELHLKHTELSSQAKEQAQHIYELEMRDSSQSVSTQVFPSLLEEIREEEALNEPVSSSELLVFGGLQASASAKNSDGLEDTGAGTKLVATGAIGGQSTPTHQQYQFKQPLNPSDNNVLSLCSLSGTTGRDNSILNSNTSENDPVSDLIHTTFSVSDDGLLISKGSPVKDTSTGHINGSVDLLSKEKCDEGNGGMSEKEQGWKDDVKQGQNNREEEDINEERRWNREEVRGEDVKEGGSAGEMAQTTDRADRREDSQRSTEDAGDSKQPETETKDRAEGEGTDGGAEDRANEGTDTPETPEIPETQIPVQTTADRTTEKSDTQRVIDFMDTESPPAVSEKDAEIMREVQTLCSSDGHQSVSHGPNSAIQEGQHLQTFAESLTQMPVRQGFENTTGEKPSDKLAATVPTEVSEPLNRSSVTICSSQTNTAPLAAQLDGAVSIQDMETTQPGNPSDTASHMEQTDEMCDTHVSTECVLVRTMIKPLTSEQESGQLKSLVTDDGDCSAYKKRERQSNADTRENHKKPQDPVEKSNLKDACLDVTVDLESAVETGSCQERKKNEDAGDAMTTNTSDLKLSVLDTDESSLPSSKTYRSSFDWASAQRKPVSSRAMSDVSVLHQFVQGSPMSEQKTNDPGGQLGHPPSTVPMFLKSKHSKVPSVITRASDLLNASSVSGTAVSSTRHQQGERRAVGETCRETAAADTDSRASLSITSFPVSTSSVTVSRLSWQTSPGCSRAPTSAAGPSAESEWEPSCFQEREDQQSSFRAQISKIEQFLNTERLRLPKRRRTDN